ncbi:hypothetical protein TNCV_3791431 [Trichonephila clavipes]|nr:hypothetical protein TNCV_3791431 [Trichonephila clavipes]
MGNGKFLQSLTFQDRRLESGRTKHSNEHPSFLLRPLRHPPPTPANQSGSSMLPIQASVRSQATYTVL